ncbi:MAG: EamA family transporter [Candidatus Aphodousia sp.]|nr:EamA family transporter [Sutterella sp.]MDY2900299.1 EamA family transporter [Candidatus Aphodousia sp.]
MKNAIKASICVVGAALSWGSIGLVQSFAQDSIPAFWIATLRLSIAAVFFLLYSCLAPGGLSFRFRIFKPIYLWVIFASLCLIANNVSFIFGVRSTGIAIGSVVTIGSAAIWAGVLSSALLHKEPNKNWWVGAILATVGAAVMVISQAYSWQVSFQGLVSCLFAGLCYAVFSVCSQRVVREVSVTTGNLSIFIVAGGLALILSLLLVPLPAVLRVTDWFVFGYLGVIATGVAFLLYNRALLSLNVRTAVTLTLFDPITSFLLAVLIAKEPLQWPALVALIFILLGLGLVLHSEE